MAALLVAPQALLSLTDRLREESAGFGFFDPASGGDPAAIVHDQLALRASAAALSLLLGWALVQAIVLLATRRSIGKNVMRAAVTARQPLTRGRALLRELPRMAVLAAIPLAHAVLTRAYPPQSAAAGTAFAPASLQPPVTDYLGLQLLTLAAVVLAAIVLASAEALIVLRSTSARSLGDLVAGTRVEPAAPVPK